MIDFKELVKAGVHFGHQASRWVPKMDPYIWGVKNKVHLIDVSKTAHQLEKASLFLQEVAAQGKQILWVGTKKPARAIVKQAAITFDMPYVDYRWIGGTLSNYGQVKKSVTRLLHFEDVISKSESYPNYTKKELNSIRKNADRLEAIVGGIKTLKWPLGAIVIVDVNREQSALKEAASVGLPIVALVDTNADPSLVDYVIPANDDAPRSIGVIIDYLKQAVEKGVQKKAAQKDAAQQAQKKVEAAPEKAVKAEPKKKEVSVAKKEAAPAKPAAKAAKKEVAPKAKAEEAPKKAPRKATESKPEKSAEKKAE
jgi:small subunit ribosomal protein S2